MRVSATRTELARGLFAPLGPTYDRYARALSFGQDPRWRRFLVSRLDGIGPEAVVLDVATGTAAVALELVRQHGCSVVGVDQSPEMLAEGRRRLALAAETQRVRLVEAGAGDLPFEDASFDGLTAAYLLRYLDDLPAGLRELARVLRPGGRLVALTADGRNLGEALRRASSLARRQMYPVQLLGRSAGIYVIEKVQS